MPWGCLRFVIVVFPDHTHLLFLKNKCLGGRYVDDKHQGHMAPKFVVFE